MRTLFILSGIVASSSAFAAVCSTTDLDLTTTGAAAAMATTTGAVDDWQPSCGLGSAGAGDYTIEFVAPMDGVYTFDLDGATYDTTISLWDVADCATQLACNDDNGAGGTWSRIEWTALAGETVVVVVDGYNGAEGNFLLNIAMDMLPVCDFDTDLGTAVGTAVAMGDTCGQNDDVQGSCGSDADGEDIVYSWTAPADGTYVVTTVGSAVDTVLNEIDGVCDEAACNDDGTSALVQGFTTASLITVDALAGDTKWFAVHNYSGFGTPECGAVVLNITDATVADADGDGIDDASDVCIGHDLVGDDDGDGFCNDVDDCVGDDATGDDDFDGICNDSDFGMTQTDIVAGAPMTFTVANAMPGSTVFFLVSASLDFASPLCHPVVTDACTNLSRPNVLGTATADPSGAASLTVPVPPVPSGFTVYSEAAWFGGGQGATTGYYVNTSL